MFSIKLKINYRRVNKKGEAALFFQVIIDGAVTTIPLNLKWPIQYFDTTKEMILPVTETEGHFSDYKLIIESERKKITDVILYYRLANKKITSAILKDELSNVQSREDFIVFWKSTIKKRFEKDLISVQTRKNNTSSLKMLECFAPTLQFREITQQFFADYHFFIRRQKSPISGLSYRINTIAKYLNDMKTYLRFARNEGIIFDDPFKDKKIATTKGSIIYLNKVELKSLWDYFNSDGISDVHKIVLRPFLFACFTGLRHSDLERVCHKHVRKNHDMEFEPYKTRELQKKVVVPLCPKAFNLIVTEKDNLFEVRANQKANEFLKEIANKCGIEKNLSTHVARHTFATQFLEMGGKLEVLKELLGHSKIETTMVYVHVTVEQKRSQINLLEDIFSV